MSAINLPSDLTMVEVPGGTELRSRRQFPEWPVRQYFGEKIDAAASSGNHAAMLAGLQAAMLAAPEKLMEGGRLVDPHEEHLFLPGLYVRQVTNEKGSLVITMKHATEHPWFCLRGHILVRNLETGELHEVHGGDRGVTLPGTQRAIYAVEETVFVTVHPNPDDCRDLAELERRFIVRQELPGGQTIGELYRSALANGAEIIPKLCIPSGGCASFSSSDEVEKQEGQAARP